ncbi:MAG: hypothetical protein MUC99_12815, partial [Anaerolineae bacterium]|nr:hypothetical protein [Anaerolineae bacterium]
PEAGANLAARVGLGLGALMALIHAALPAVQFARAGVLLIVDIAFILVAFGAFGWFCGWAFKRLSVTPAASGEVSALQLDRRQFLVRVGGSAAVLTVAGAVVGLAGARWPVRSSAWPVPVRAAPMSPYLPPTPPPLKAREPPARKWPPPTTTRISWPPQAPARGRMAFAGHRLGRQRAVVDVGRAARHALGLRNRHHVVHLQPDWRPAD